MTSDYRMQILIAATLMITVGLIFVFSAGTIQALNIGRGELYFFHKQFFSVLTGFIAMYVAYKMPLEKWRKLVPVLFFVTITLLITVFMFNSIKGAHRWIVMPGFSFQPSELAKLTAIVYLAHYLEKKEGRMDDFSRGFLPASIMLGIMGALILIEPDYGTTLLIILVSFALFMVGGASFKHVVGVVGFIAPILITGLLAGYRRGRILSFIDPWADRYGTGYQLIQSLTAVGSGGIFGKGIGNSSQKLHFLPEAHTDFIYAIIAEETGLLGALFVVMLIVIFFVAGVSVAMKHTDKFKRLLTFGIAFCLAAQAMFNIAVVIGMLPTKGIGLPFISYGGSNMVLSMLFVGMLLRSASELENKRR